LSLLDQNTIESVDVNTEGNTIGITTKTITSNSDSKTNTVITFSGQQEKPIVFINGKLTSSDFDMNDVDPKKIGSMNVLKGQHATEKYGSDGKNGVIEITTKNPTDKDGNEKRVYRGYPTVNTFSISSSTTDTKTKAKAKQLIIVDGVIVKDKSMNDLNSLDIEKMEIYKGTEAVAKYGEKAKDGVIVITTRK